MTLPSFSRTTDIPGCVGSGESFLGFANATRTSWDWAATAAKTAAFCCWMR